MFANSVKQTPLVVAYWSGAEHTESLEAATSCVLVLEDTYVKKMNVIMIYI